MSQGQCTFINIVVNLPEPDITKIKAQKKIVQLKNMITLIGQH